MKWSEVTKTAGRWVVFSWPKSDSGLVALRVKLPGDQEEVFAVDSTDARISIDVDFDAQELYVSNESGLRASYTLKRLS